MRKILVKQFYGKPAPVVAKNLLGKYLVRKIGREIIRLQITEVEAYDGFKDKASHANRGKTARNQGMFDAGGKWYVYFVYGTHWMLNIVTGPKDYPAAVLIRGAGEIAGPARLTKFLKIDEKLNGAAASRKSGLWIEDRGIKVPPSKIKRTPRVGVAYAGAIWSKKLYRFISTIGEYVNKYSCTVNYKTRRRSGFCRNITERDGASIGKI